MVWIRFHDRGVSVVKRKNKGCSVMWRRRKNPFHLVIMMTFAVLPGQRWTNVSVLTFSYKEVEHRDDHRVPTEHVVSTGLNACQCHPESTPDRDCPLYLGKGVVISLHGNQTEAMSAKENNGGSSVSLTVQEIRVKNRERCRQKKKKQSPILTCFSPYWHTSGVGQALRGRWRTLCNNEAEIRFPSRNTDAWTEWTWNKVTIHNLHAFE